MEVGRGEGCVLDIGEGDDMVGVEGKDTVGADLLDIGHHGSEAAELRLLQLDDIERRLEVVDGLVAEIVGKHKRILAEAAGVEGIARAPDQGLMGVEAGGGGERGIAGAAVEHGIAVTGGGGAAGGHYDISRVGAGHGDAQCGRGIRAVAVARGVGEVVDTRSDR
jgi:hypothetical protein